MVLPRGRVVDRMIAWGIFIGVGCVTLWCGAQLINHWLDAKFCHTYLFHWELALQKFSQTNVQWPEFTGKNYTAYMMKLTTAMRQRTIDPPQSGTDMPNRYYIDKIGAEKQDIFLLCFFQKIIIFGLHRQTVERTDRCIDGRIDAKRGDFTYTAGKDGQTYIGNWKL